MDLLAVVIRTVFFYVFVIIILRIMGKREIGELSVSDFVISLLITELVAIGIDRYDQTMWLTVVPILILLFFEVSSAFLSLKFNKFRNLIEGKPSLIINRGIINYKEMIKQRYTLDDLLLALRNKGIKDLRDVEYAVLEANGISTVPLPAFCDAYIINTCTVTAQSDRKARQFIRRAISKNPSAYIIVTGCLAQTAPEDIAKINGVDFICGNSSKLTVAEKLIEYFNKSKPKSSPTMAKMKSLSGYGR